MQDNASTLLLYLGHPELAIAVDEFANTRDPINPIGHFNLALKYFMAGS